MRRRGCGAGLLLLLRQQGKEPVGPARETGVGKLTVTDSDRATTRHNKQVSESDTVSVWHVSRAGTCGVTCLFVCEHEQRHVRVQQEKPALAGHRPQTREKPSPPGMQLLSCQPERSHS